VRLRISLSEPALRRLIERAVQDRRPINLEAEHLLEQLLLGEQPPGQAAEAHSGREGAPCR